MTRSSCLNGACKAVVRVRRGAETRHVRQMQREKMRKPRVYHCRNIARAFLSLRRGGGALHGVNYAVLSS